MAQEKQQAESNTGSIWDRAKGWLRDVSGKAQPVAELAIDPKDITDPCCGPQVNIAYRGKADDRLYMAQNRTWQEVPFFQPIGLRVFCAGCRRRLL